MSELLTIDSVLSGSRHGGRSRGVPSLCLIHTPCKELNDDRLEPPLGLLYLATEAQAEGYNSKIIDLSAHDGDDLFHRIPDGFDVYGFSTYSVNYGLTIELFNRTKSRNPNSLFVAGGPHASALPKQVSMDGFDVVVTGEGEVAIIQILDNLQSGTRTQAILPGIPPNPLDELPFPDYGLVEMSSYSRELAGQRCVSILSSRGCPYRCSFCNSNIMGAGRPMRYRSPENVVQEIREVKARYQVNHFRFQDDIFTINQRRISQLTPHLANEEIVYRCFARVNTHSKKMAGLLRDGGCVHVSFGVETGSPILLAKHAMHKGQTPDQIKDALNNAFDAGLRIRIFLIVGFPGETDDTIEETLSLVKQCPWHEFSVYPLIAYPGTPLHEQPESFGITHIDNNYSDYLQIGRNFKAGFTIRTATFDEGQVRRWRDHVRDELFADGRMWAGSSQGFK